MFKVGEKTNVKRFPTKSEVSRPYEYPGIILGIRKYKTPTKPPKYICSFFVEGEVKGSISITKAKNQIGEDKRGLAEKF